MPGKILNPRLHPPSSQTHGIPGQTLLPRLPTQVTTTSTSQSPLVVPDLVSSQRRETLGQTLRLPLRPFHLHPIGATTLSIVHLSLAV